MTRVFLVERSIELSNLIWEGLGEIEQFVNFLD
jgi:hypothetical protein